MPNIYLEKIALTIEDTRSARVGGLKAGRKVERKGELVGAGIGAGIGGAVGYGAGRKMAKDTALHEVLAANKISPRKLKAGVAGITGVIGALHGVGFGNAAVVNSAEKAKVKEHTRLLNKSLTKSAAVTENQVRTREARNGALTGLGSLGGMVGGTGAALGAVAGRGVHKGLKDTGGYTSAKNSLRNAYQRKKTEKSLGKGVTLMGKGQAVALSTGSRESIARGTGNAMGKALSKRGLIGGIAGAIAGSSLASHAVRKRTDASDVDHYKKLSKKNG